MTLNKVFEAQTFANLKPVSHLNWKMTISVKLAQFSTLFGLFFSMVLFTWLPLKLLRKRQLSPEILSTKYENVISLANCLSGGVFLATFFIGLLPEVRLEMRAILRDYHLTTSLPLTEVVVIFGFFLAVFVEQFALTVKEAKNHKHDQHSHTQDCNGINRPVIREQQFPLDDDMLEIAPTNVPTTSTASLVHEWDSDDPCASLSILPSSSVQSQTLASRSPNNDQNHGHGHGHSHDHGHGHSHDVEALLKPTSGLRFGILLMSLGVHSLFEGMALGLQSEVHTLLNLFIGVWIHECLIAFALGFSMVKLQVTNCRLWQISILFSSMIPFGQIVGILLGSSESSTSRISSTILQAIAAGTFIQVTFFEIIPEGLGEHQNKCRMLKVFLLFFGFVSIAAVTFLVQSASEP